MVNLIVGIGGAVVVCVVAYLLYRSHQDKSKIDVPGMGDGLGK